GPIMRMFLGVISWRRPASTCWRRQRLRSAMATARLAAAWPTMWWSSSETISWGVMEDIVQPKSASSAYPESASSYQKNISTRLQRLYGVVHVGVDAQLAGDLQRLLD